VRIERRLTPLILMILIVGGLLLYTAYPLLIYGMNLLLFIIVQGVSVLLALPQVLWWLLAVIIFIFLGLKLLLRLGKNIFSGSGIPLTVLSFHGRLSALRQCICSARSAPYSQDEVRQLLRSLAIDLIALKLDISQEEARNRFSREDWTQDQTLKVYLYKERDFEARRLGQRLLQWFRKSETPEFLRETKETIARLKYYRDFADGGEKNDITNFDD